MLLRTNWLQESVNDIVKIVNMQNASFEHNQYGFPKQFWLRLPKVGKHCQHWVTGLKKTSMVINWRCYIVNVKYDFVYREKYTLLTG